MMCVFSDAEVVTASHSEGIQDHQLIVGSNDDCWKLQHNGTSQSRPDVKLSVFNVDTKDDVTLVECQLEMAKHPSVSFKFRHLIDQPTDVAASLVRSTLYVVKSSLHTHSSFVSHMQLCLV